MTPVFKIGDKVDLVQKSSSAGGKVSERQYASRIIDFDMIRTVKLSAPIQDGHLVPLSVGDDYDLIVFTKAGLYSCRGRIKKRYLEKKISVLDVLIISEFKKYQRREFFRLECSFNMAYRIITLEEKQLRVKLATDNFNTPAEKNECKEKLAKMEPEWLDATITNLSGGGVKFHSKDYFKKDEITEVKIPLQISTGFETLTFFARVIESTENMKMLKTFDTRCEFLSMSGRERELIVKFVFEQQRKKMSGGDR
ncbi:MAG: flagellar brake protein [Eubacterium sp.]|nr:flagellar brake protein [Eubacterium sp.]